MIASPLIVMPVFKRVVPRGGDLPSRVVGPVAADVDHAAGGLEPALCQRLHGVVNPGADRGPPVKERGAWVRRSANAESEASSRSTVQSSTVLTS